MSLLKYSIIIPVYNVEAYIKECVDSVISQSYGNIEIILVDDGSPDGCPQICDDYAQSDSRVVVIHQQNGGLSKARNAGLKKASGDYILFLDSDDYYFKPDFLSAINNLLEADDCEMLMYQRRKYFEASETWGDFPSLYAEGSLGNKDTNAVYELLSKEDQLDASATMKVMRRDFLLDNQLFFRAGMLSEDVEWFFRVSHVVSTVMVTNEVAHCCRVRSGSISRSIKMKNIDDLFFSIVENADVLRAQADSPKRKALLNYLAYQYFIVLGLTSAYLHGKEKQLHFKKYSEYRWLVEYCMSPKVKKAAIVFRMVGMRAASFVLGKYIISK